MFESIQKLAPWVAALPLVPKLAITAAWFLLSFVFFYIVWVPTKKMEVYEQPEVIAAYKRMARVLRRITIDTSGNVSVDGHMVPLAGQYYSKYASIAEF